MPTDLEQMHWMASYPKGNIGLPFGPASGLCAIDIDTEDKDLIRYRLLPRCLSHVSDLDRMIDTVKK